MAMLESIKQYTKAVWSYWWWLMAGLVGGIVGIANFLGVDVPISLPIGLGVLFICFSIAQFLAFNKVRVERDTQKIKALSIVRSKTETLLEMRESSFYDVVNTLDKIREQIDITIESKPKEIQKLYTLELIQDLISITGTNIDISQAKTPNFFNRQSMKTFNTSMSNKWGDFKNPNDPQVVKFILEFSGIIKEKQNF
jgi:hypothetical protein